MCSSWHLRVRAKFAKSLVAEQTKSDFSKTSNYSHNFKSLLAHLKISHLPLGTSFFHSLSITCARNEFHLSSFTYHPLTIQNAPPSTTAIHQLGRQDLLVSSSLFPSHLPLPHHRLLQISHRWHLILLDRFGSSRHHGLLLPRRLHGMGPMENYHMSFGRASFSSRRTVVQQKGDEKKFSEYLGWGMGEKCGW